MPLSHPIIDQVAISVHDNLNLHISQDVDLINTGKLAAIIRFEYLRCAVCDECFLQGFNAKSFVNTFGVPRCQNLTSMPVHDCYKIQDYAECGYM